MTTSQLEIVQFDLAVLGFALWRPWITILALVAVLLARVPAFHEPSALLIALVGVDIFSGTRNFHVLMATGQFVDEDLLRARIAVLETGLAARVEIKAAAFP